MKGTYITIEIILVAALLRFGEKVGTNNMWFVIVAIIISHFVMEFLYKLRLYSEHKHKSTNIVQPTTNSYESTIDDTIKLDIDIDADTATRDFFKMDIS